MRANINRRIVQSITSEMGLQFELITDPEHHIITNEETRDPEIVYLVDPRIPKNTNQECNAGDRSFAMLYWKGASHSIMRNQITIESIRGLLQRQKSITQNQHCEECVVCFERIESLKSINCSQCNNETCTMCRIKISLTADAIQRVRSGDYMLSFDCTECRTTSHVDIRSLYPQVMDRLQEFNANQQEIINLIRQTHPEYELQHKRMEQRLGNTDRVIIKQLRNGSRVRVIGTKNEEWRGQRAKIIGNQINKADGTIRWPVQQLLGSKAKASIKQINLMKL